MRSKLKVLLIAEAANPDWVSVPLVGWSLAKALCDEVDGHLVTQVRNSEAISRTGWIEGSDFTAIDSESLARPMWKAANVLRMGSGKGWTMATAISSLTYPYFEHLVWKKFGPDIRAGKYDIVHRVTPLSPTAKSSIARRCRKAGVPFVLGPLNGGVPWPPGFDAERRREREYLSYIRGIYKALPGRQSMLGATSAILTGSHYTASEIPDAHRSKCIHLPENAIDSSRFNRVASQDVTLPLRGCFIGRMVPYKGADMLLEAAAPLLRDGKLALDMIGDGPMLSSLKALAEREGIEERVTFHGWLEHTLARIIHQQWHEGLAGVAQAFALL
jgi:glycogen(starch) synthase